MNRRVLLCYLLATGTLALAIFGGALWGARLLAPVDIAPALWSKYGWVNPGGPEIPANHYTIDQLSYDLPLQYTLHAAYQRGEMPWWDPYTYSGRPLLADGHVNGTDPIRLLCYASLPFELAYNWTLILHWMLGGLGVLCLLDRWRVHPVTNVGLVLAFQCGGYYALMFGHPWNAGSFLFYPWVWLAWEAWCVQRRWWSWPLGVLAIAGIFYTGNLQSHAYLVLFAIAFLASYGGSSLGAWRTALSIVVASGVLGAALAAPVLAGQLELYRLSARPMNLALSPISWLSGMASICGVYPWVLGTFRTLDLSKLFDRYDFFDQYALGFAVFIGSAGVALGALGAWRGKSVALLPQRHRLACGLVLVYLLVQSTPLQAVFYTRAAGLAMLGLVVLAAFGLEYLRTNTQPLRRGAFALAAISIATILALNLFAFAVYPSLLPRVREAVLRKDGQGTSIDLAPALREFQVQNLPREISVRNPETWLATLSLLALASLFWRPEWRRKSWALPGLLLLNLAPAAMFYARFIPNQPIALWHRLEKGGPEQQKVASLLGGHIERVQESAPGVHDQFLPNCLGHLYQVRTVHGYAALSPTVLFLLPPAERERWKDVLADFTYSSAERGAAAGGLTANTGAPSPVSFQWRGSEPRSLKARLISLNVQEVVLEPGPAGTLLWTDTAYPGWRAEIDSAPATIRPVPPCFSEIDVPAGGRMVLRLRYRPTWLGLGMVLASGAMAGTLLVTVGAFRQSGAAAQANNFNAAGPGGKSDRTPRLRRSVSFVPVSTPRTLPRS